MSAPTRVTPPHRAPPLPGRVVPQRSAPGTGTRRVGWFGSETQLLPLLWGPIPYFTYVCVSQTELRRLRQKGVLQERAERPAQQPCSPGRQLGNHKNCLRAAQGTRTNSSSNFCISRLFLNLDSHKMTYPGSLSFPLVKNESRSLSNAGPWLLDLAKQLSRNSEIVA